MELVITRNSHGALFMKSTRGGVAFHSEHLGSNKVLQFNINHSFKASWWFGFRKSSTGKTEERITTTHRCLPGLTPPPWQLFQREKIPGNDDTNHGFPVNNLISGGKWAMCSAQSVKQLFSPSVGQNKFIKTKEFYRGRERGREREIKHSIRIDSKSEWNST